MSTTIVQKVLFKNTTTKDLYDLYMNAKKHSATTLAPAKITDKEGAAFSAHGGYISGKNLRLVKNKLIVQTWRAQSWSKEDADSVFIIHLEQKGKDVVLHATHANVPDQHEESLSKGWHNHYWKPWKKFLSGKLMKKYPQM
jgi:activator of HSP90 ATPase